MEGQYKIAVFFAGREIPKSPYVVNIEGMAGDASKVVVDGPGIDDTGRVRVNKMTSFSVHTASQSHSLSVCVCGRLATCVALCSTGLCVCLTVDKAYVNYKMCSYQLAVLCIKCVDD